MSAHNIFDYILVKGSGVYEIKDELKKMRGRWDPYLKGWFVREHFRNEVMALLNKNNMASSSQPGLRHIPQIANTSTTKSETSPEERRIMFETAVEEAGGHNIDYINILSYTDKSFVVYGATKKVKAELSALGGSWNKTLIGWIFPNKYFDEVEAFVDDTNNFNMGGPENE